MTLEVRRIVTDHDDDGKAIVSSDALMTNITQLRSGNHQSLIWVNDATPARLDDDTDPANRDMDIEPPGNGAVFRVLELAPGKQAYMHRTDTIDYAVVMAGECDLLLDDSEVHMQAGNVLVQRGTWHGGANRGAEPCQIVFILIDAVAPAKHLHP